MSTTQREAELAKLARVLDVEADALVFLAATDATLLRQLREGTTRAFFERFRDAFAGFARVSTLLPAALGARVSQHVLGATLSAGIAGEMPPERAIALALKMPDDFLAQTCVAMEPSRARPIIEQFPLDRALAITRILLAQGEHIVMGQFVDVLPTPVLLAASDVMESPTDLLRIAFFVEDGAQLERVVAHLSTARRDGLIEAAVAHDLWPQVMDTLQRVGRAVRIELAEHALSQGEPVLDSLIHAAAAHGLWPVLLEQGSELAPEWRARLVEQPAFAMPAIIESALDSMTTHANGHHFAVQLECVDTPRLGLLLDIAATRRAAFLSAFDHQDRMPETIADRLAEAARRQPAESHQAIRSACGNGPLGRKLHAQELGSRA